MARPIQPWSPNRLVRLRGLSFCCRSGRCQLPQLAPILGGGRHHFTSAHPIRSILNELRGELETNQSRTPGDTGLKLEVSEQAIHAACLFNSSFGPSCQLSHGWLLASSFSACMPVLPVVLSPRSRAVCAPVLAVHHTNCHSAA